MVVVLPTNLVKPELKYKPFPELEGSLLDLELN
jgi:hypothetical protein